MTKAIFFILKFTFISILLHPQVPQASWHKCYGGIINDRAGGICVTSDGAYAIAGTSNSQDGDMTGPTHGAKDSWILKVTTAGTLTWQKNIGGSSDDYTNFIKQTADGGFIVGGQTYSPDGNFMNANYHGLFDAWAAKLNSSGAIQWIKCYGGSGGEVFNDVECTSDGGYIFVGYSGSNNGDLTNNYGALDVWAVKTNSAGVKQWQKNFGGSTNDLATCIKKTANNSYLIGGWASDNWGSTFYGNYDGFLLKIDNAGNVGWTKMYGGSGNDEFTTLTSSSDGSLLVCGNSDSSDGDLAGQNSYGNLDFWALKIDTLGNIKWQRTYGGNNNDLGCRIVEATNGYFICGYTNSVDQDASDNHGANDVWLANLDTSRNISGSLCFGGTNMDGVSDCVAALDGGYLLVGTAGSTDGNVPDNHSQDNDLLIIKTNAVVGLKENAKHSDQIIIFPVPAKEYLNINIRENRKFKHGKYQIVDMTSRVILDGVIYFGTETLQIRTDQLLPGAYSINIIEDGSPKVTKVFVVAY